MKNKIALAVIDTKGGKVQSTNQSDKQIISLTARESQGLGPSIRKRPDTRKRPDYHYDQRTDQNVPENILGFFNVSNHGSYNQGDTNCARQIYERILEGMRSDIDVKFKEKYHPYHRHHDRQCRESQNNADYIAHPSILGSFLQNLNKGITPIAGEFRGSGKPGIRVNQSDGQILTLLTAIRNQQITSNLVGNI